MFKTILTYRKKEENLSSEKETLLVNFITVTALFALLYATVSFLIGFNYGIIAMVICFFIYVFTLLLFLKEKINYKTTSNLYIANAYFVSITTCSFFSGGDISPVLPWFLLVPVISLLLLGKCQTTFIWLFLSVFAMLSATLAGIYGYSFPVAYNYDLVKHFSLICIVGLAAIIFIVTILFEKEKEKSYRLLEKKNQEILDSINYAKRIQSAILPPIDTFKSHLGESFILYEPKDAIGGDFYWLKETNNEIIFAAADCTGHGIPGAMVSVVCNNALNQCIREFNVTSPDKILDKTRSIVEEQFATSQEVRDGMDISLCSINKTTRLLRWSGANNPLWIIRNGQAKIDEIKPNKQPIGKYELPEPFTEHQINLNVGDTIYIFTDGYADQFGGEKGKKFKPVNLRKVLLSIQDESMDMQRTIMIDTFKTWRGDLEQIDDVCVIGVRI